MMQRRAEILVENVYTTETARQYYQDEDQGDTEGDKGSSPLIGL